MAQVFEKVHELIQDEFKKRQAGGISSRGHKVRLVVCFCGGKVAVMSSNFTSREPRASVYSRRDSLAN